MTVQKEFNANDFRKSWSTYIILGLALGAMLFFGICNPQSFVTQLDNVAASVAGEEITQVEFSRAYMSESERARVNNSDRHVAEKVIDQLLNYRMMYLEAKQLGLTVSDEEIITYLTEAGAFQDKGKFSQEAFHNFLRSNRYSEETFLAEMRRNLTIDKLREILTQATYISDKNVDTEYRNAESKMKVDYIRINPEQIKLQTDGKEVEAYLADKDGAAKTKEYYESHKSEYHVPEKMHARHILISHKEARNASGEALKRTKQEAEIRAKALLQSIKEKKLDFVATAKKETDEQVGKGTGGDLGFFSADTMVKEFSQAAFALKPGEISSQPVESPFGYHIIQAVEKKPAVNKSFDDAKHAIAQILIDEKKLDAVAKETAGKILAAVKENKPVDDLLKSVNAKWETSEEFAMNANFIKGIGNNAKVIEAAISLKNKGDLVKEPVEAQRNFFIMRLNSRTVADPSTLDAKTRERLQSNLNERLSYIFMRKFEQLSKEKYEKRNAIYRNPQYLALDKEKSE